MTNIPASVNKPTINAQSAQDKWMILANAPRITTAAPKEMMTFTILFVLSEIVFAIRKIYKIKSLLIVCIDQFN
jgi:hypothetical protein